MNSSVTTIIFAVLIIGVLAFLTTAITEATKGIGFLNKIPTKLQVLILAIVLCVTFYFAYISYAGIAPVWYLIVGAVLLGFLVALIAANGWAYVISMLKRYVRTDVVNDITETIKPGSTKNGSD